jgi:CubicO group peptidase (beta-lactamase class C family)
MATLTTPASVSMDSQKLEQVTELFHRQIGAGLHPGAGLAVYRYGSLVLDIYGGAADAKTGRPVDDNTMFVLFSSTKPLAASCIYMLKERGRLEWDDPVAKFWPEFAAHGKDKVTVRHLLSHQGGFPETPASLPWTDWADWSKVCAAMEQAIPKYAAGEVMSYHPINYGWVIAELVRRIDGRSFDRFLAEDLAAPLQMQNTYVNLPPEHDGRVSRIHLLEDDADPNGYAGVFDKPEVHHTITPGANGIASAGDLARFYAMMERRGTLDRAQVLRPETISEGVTLQVEGTDLSLDLFARRSLGLALADERTGTPSGDPLHTFGHGGAGTSIGWADFDSGLAVGYITNGFRGPDKNNPRLAEISQAVRDACA